MLKATILLFIVIFVCQSNEVRGNAVSNSIKTEPETKDLPRFEHSWSLPSFSSFSISNLFKDKDKSDDIAILKKKVQALEESQLQIFELLKQLTIVSKSTVCNDKLNSTQLTNNEQSEKKSGKMENSSTTDDKIGYYTTENIINDQMKSDDVTTIKADDSNTITPSTTTEEEKTPSTEMDENGLTEVAVIKNEEQDITNENYEKTESMEKNEGMIDLNETTNSTKLILQEERET